MSKSYTALASRENHGIVAVTVSWAPLWYGVEEILSIIETDLITFSGTSLGAPVCRCGPRAADTTPQRQFLRKRSESHQTGSDDEPFIPVWAGRMSSERQHQYLGTERDCLAYGLQPFSPALFRWAFLGPCKTLSDYNVTVSAS